MITISQIDPELSIYKENTVVIWGAGQYGRVILQLLKNFDVKVSYFCDSSTDKWKTEIDGIPVILPQELMKMKLEQSQDKGEIVVQTAMIPRYEAQVKPQVEGIGIGKVVCYQEAWQMLRFYLKCDKFRENPKLLELKDKVPHYFRSRHEVDAFEYIFTNEKNLGILVCMPGKTGDVTVMETFLKNGIKCFQNHNSWTVHKDIFPGQEVKIITAVRDPIARDISSCYQSASNHSVFPYDNELYLEKSNDMQLFYDFFTDPKKRKQKQDEIAERLGYKKLPKQFMLSWEGDWFSKFGESVLDLLQHPFDQEKGYTIIKEENIEVFCYQLEKLNHLAPELSNWVGVPFAEFVMGNEAKGKWIANSYEQAKKELKISPEYFDICYNDPYIQHFYSQDDIEKFKDKWRKNIDTKKN